MLEDFLKIRDLVTGILIKNKTNDIPYEVRLKLAMISSETAEAIKILERRDLDGKLCTRDNQTPR